MANRKNVYVIVMIIFIYYEVVKYMGVKLPTTVNVNKNIPCYIGSIERDRTSII
jgi:hypothetical protein